MTFCDFSKFIMTFCDIYFKNMDITLIINKLKEHLNIKFDKELADFLGIKPNTVATWKKRNTIDIDIIMSKCDLIDANWLLTGKGNMLKNKYDYDYKTDIVEEPSNIDTELSPLERTLRSKEETINILKEHCRIVRKDLEECKKAYDLLLEKYLKLKG